MKYFKTKFGGKNICTFHNTTLQHHRLANKDSPLSMKYSPKTIRWFPELKLPNTQRQCHPDGPLYIASKSLPGTKRVNGQLTTRSTYHTSVVNAYKVVSSANDRMLH